MASLPPPVIEEHEDFVIVRDDLVPGGSKRRVLGELLKDIEADELVYPATAYGYGPLAVAHTAKDMGKQAVLFYAKRNRENWTPLMEEAASLGAKIVPVAIGYMNVVKSRAETYCETRPRSLLLPLGFDTEEFRQAFVRLAKVMTIQPGEVWCAAGTGALTRALQQAWPKAEHHAVVVARKDADTGQAIRHVLQVPFEKAAKDKPPFPSAANYDAKVWAEMKKQARPGALFWNVGA